MHKFLKLWCHEKKNPKKPRRELGLRLGLGLGSGGGEGSYKYENNNKIIMMIAIQVKASSLSQKFHHALSFIKN